MIQIQDGAPLVSVVMGRALGIPYAILVEGSVIVGTRRGLTVRHANHRVEALAKARSAQPPPRRAGGLMR